MKTEKVPQDVGQGWGCQGVGWDVREREKGDVKTCGTDLLFQGHSPGGATD